MISVIKDTFNDKAYSEAVAMVHLRFGIIALDIQRLFNEPSKTTYYNKVAEKSIVLADVKEIFFITIPLKRGRVSTKGAVLMPLWLVQDRMSALQGSYRIRR